MCVHPPLPHPPQAFSTWRETTAKERSDLLRRWFELCNESHDELARILTLEQGKPIAESMGEIGYGSSFFEWFSEEARRINGDVSSKYPTGLLKLTGVTNLRIKL